MATAPGCLHRREDHKEEPLLFRPFLGETIGTAAAGALLGRAMAFLCALVMCVCVGGGRIMIGKLSLYGRASVGECVGLRSHASMCMCSLLTAPSHHTRQVSAYPLYVCTCLVGVVVVSAFS